MYKSILFVVIAVLLAGCGASGTGYLNDAYENKVLKGKSVKLFPVMNEVFSVDIPTEVKENNSINNADVSKFVTKGFADGFKKKVGPDFSVQELQGNPDNDMENITLQTGEVERELTIYSKSKIFSINPVPELYIFVQNISVKPLDNPNKYNATADVLVYDYNYGRIVTFGNYESQFELDKGKSFSLALENIALQVLEKLKI